MIRMSDTGWVLSIDFGTSNTAAAHVNPVQGNIEAVSLSNDQRSMPSSVFVDSPSEISAGTLALSKALDNPNGFVPSPKRIVSQYVSTVNGYEVDTTDLVAAVYVNAVARAARQHNNTLPSSLILTHPEAWSRREVQVLIDAASRTGIPPNAISTISEPKAAAAYYTRGKEVTPGDKLAVFDLGGGTVDIAVLQAEAGGSFTVMAAGGNNAVGGKSFDALIRRWVDEELSHTNPDLLDFLRSKAPLRDILAVETAIRTAKEHLSETASAPIVIHAGGYEERLQLTREEFEKIIAPPLDRAVELTRRTFAQSGVTSPSEVKALYLTGGSSRVPAVQEALKSLAPLATLDDPKTVVAQGALIASGLAHDHASAKAPLSSAAPTLKAEPHTKAKTRRRAAPVVSTDRVGRDATPKKRRSLLVPAIALVTTLIVVAPVGWAIIADRKDNFILPDETAQVAFDIYERAPNSVKPSIKRNSCGDAYPSDGSSRVHCRLAASEFVPEANSIEFTLNEQVLAPQFRKILGRERPADPTYKDSFAVTENILYVHPGGTSLTVIDTRSAHVYYYDAETDILLDAHGFYSSQKATEWAKEYGLITSESQIQPYKQY